MQVEELARLMNQKKLTLCTAESCTGGGISKACTAISGSSGWFDGAYVTYSNESKTRMLGVSEQSIQAFGAVSKQVALEMVLGAARHVDVAVSVTGVAGPSGGSVEKPVGTVWIAWKVPGHSPMAERYLFDGDRDAVRDQTIKAAINGLICRLRD